MRILLGVTAGIAAYKVPFLIRLLVKQGAEVRCVMTPDARDFVSPLVLSTLSNHPVAIEFWNKETGAWNNHVALAEWADLLVICPCTANTLSKMASGACDNLLLAIFFRCATKLFCFLLWIWKCIGTPPFKETWTSCSRMVPLLFRLNTEN